MIKPRNDVVMIQRIVPKYEGRMVIPDTAQEKPLEAKVIAVGPGAWGEDGNRRPIDLSPGDMVYVGRYSGTEIEFEGQKYIFVRENEILGGIWGKS